MGFPPTDPGGQANEENTLGERWEVKKSLKEGEMGAQGNPRKKGNTHSVDRVAGGGGGMEEKGWKNLGSGGGDLREHSYK